MNPDRPAGPPLSVLDARARDPGLEVVKKLTRRHGPGVFLCISTAPLWLMLFEEHVYPSSRTRYMDALRLGLVLVSSFITYGVVFCCRELIKFMCCKSTMCEDIRDQGCCCVTVEGAEREDNFSSPHHAHYSAAQQSVNLGVRHVRFEVGA